jgi:hypothetical protein
LPELVACDEPAAANSEFDTGTTIAARSSLLSPRHADPSAPVLVEG